MMYPKPKSAPGRFMQSKFVKNRTNAMKEIEAWVKKDDERSGTAHEASRMSGQLTDNVTEERMLRAKLWELSKERYKFLTQNAYEKKMFADRMQRKSSALLRRANSAAGNSSRDGDGASSRAGITPVSPARQRWRLARLALLQSRDIAKHQDKTKGEDEKPRDKGEEKRMRSAGGGQRRVVTPTTTTSGVAVTNPAAGADAGGNKVIPAPLPGPLALKEEGPAPERHQPPPKSASNPRNVKFNKVPAAETGRLPGGHTSTASRNRSSPHTTPGSTPAPGTSNARPPSGSALSSKPNSATSSRSRLWAAKTTTSTLGGKRGILASRFGMRLESKTTDPRYAQLEHSLSPIQKQRSQADVRSIVQSFDSLHVPPRRRKEAKPKTELKALEYIEEQGFAF